MQLYKRTIELFYSGDINLPRCKQSSWLHLGFINLDIYIFKTLLKLTKITLRLNIFFSPMKHVDTFPDAVVLKIKFSWHK